jgi:hypothetical protein
MGIVVGIVFAVILGALVAAGVVMVRTGRSADGKGSEGGAMMRALAVRIGVSIALFLGLLLAWRLGWIAPTGLPLR